MAYQAMVTKYCVGCHNTRNPLPAGAPLALDKANLADPAADTATWERVVKKLGVGAMPPQGSPTPGHEELTKFRSALVARLDASAAKKNTPAASYSIVSTARSTRTPSAICSASPLTSRIFCRATAETSGSTTSPRLSPTSPLLLERYLSAGLRIAELAVGDAGAEPGTHTYTISTVVTQTQHVDGLPLGTRGGMLVRHHFLADGEYVFSGRLLKTVAEGLVGVEGHETPHQFVVTVDGKQVFSAPIGGKDGPRRRHREQAGGA